MFKDILGQDPARSNIVMDIKCLHQVQNFKNVGCEISYENGKEHKNLQKCSQILAVLNNNHEETLVQKFSSIVVYYALSVPILLYRCEIWIRRNQNKKRLASIEVKVFGRTAEYILFVHRGMKKFWKC
jgi:hypothetical protein